MVLVNASGLSRVLALVTVLSACAPAPEPDAANSRAQQPSAKHAPRLTGDEPQQVTQSAEEPTRATPEPETTAALSPAMTVDEPPTSIHVPKGSLVDARLPGDCASPHVVLAQGPEDHGAQRSTALVELLRANPELELVNTQPTQPLQVRVFELPRETEPTIHQLGVLCARGETCTRVAALYRLIRIEARPQLGCSFSRSEQELLPAAGLNRLDAPFASADPDAVCSRLTACSVVTRSAVVDCDIDRARMTRCAKLSACQQVVDCSHAVAHQLTPSPQIKVRPNPRLESRPGPEGVEY